MAPPAGRPLAGDADARLRSLRGAGKDAAQPASVPKKPVRTALENGRFLCYKCKTNWAVCDDREKSCRQCFLSLVRSTVITNLGKVEEAHRQVQTSEQTGGAGDGAKGQIQDALLGEETQPASQEDLEAALRAHLHAVLAEDGNAFETFLRVIIFRSLFHYFLHTPSPHEDRLPAPCEQKQKALEAQSKTISRSVETGQEKESETHRSVLRKPALLCVGDNSTRLAVRLLLKACQGDGLTLQQDAQLVDHRLLPTYSLVRPLLSISAKEAALYCRYAGVPFLSTQPYSLVLPFQSPASPLHPLSTLTSQPPDAETLPTGSKAPASDAALAARPSPLSFLIRAFLLDLQRNFPSTVSNVLKTSQKAAPVSGLFSLLSPGEGDCVAAFSSREGDASPSPERKNGSAGNAPVPVECEDSGRKDNSHGEAQVRPCALCFHGVCDPRAFADEGLWDTNQRMVLFTVPHTGKELSPSLSPGRVPLCMPCARAACAGPASASVASTVSSVFL